MNRDELLLGFEWIAFSPDQRAAVEKAWEWFNSCDAAREQLKKDLLWVENSNRPISEPDELQARFGEYGLLHHVLVLIAALPRAVAEYKLRGYPESVLREGLLDIPVWMEHYQKSTGKIGFVNIGWCAHALRFELFRIGRLEYMDKTFRYPARVFQGRNGFVTLAPNGLQYTQSGEAFNPELTNVEGKIFTSAFVEDERGWTGNVIESDGLATPKSVFLSKKEYQPFLQQGDPVLEIHIPAGLPLDPDAVERSMQEAPHFFAQYLGKREYKALVCSSWLLDRDLMKLAPGSRVGQFAERFTRIPFPSSDFQLFERVFGEKPKDFRMAPRDTLLRRQVLDWYAAGHHCRNLAGYIPLKGKK